MSELKLPFTTRNFSAKVAEKMGAKVESLTEDQLELRKISTGIPKKFQSEKGPFHSLRNFFYGASSIKAKKEACEKIERFINLSQKHHVNVTNLKLHLKKMKEELSRNEKLEEMLNEALNEKDWAKRKIIFEAIQDQPLPYFQMEKLQDIQVGLALS